MNSVWPKFIYYGSWSKKFSKCHFRGSKDYRIWTKIYFRNEFILRIYICLFIGHLPFKPDMVSQLEAEEKLWMMERETQRNGYSRENHTAVSSGTSYSGWYQLLWFLPRAWFYHSCLSMVTSRLDWESSLHIGLPASSPAFLSSVLNMVSEWFFREQVGSCPSPAESPPETSHFTPSPHSGLQDPAWSGCLTRFLCGQLCSYPGFHHPWCPGPLGGLSAVSGPLTGSPLPGRRVCSHSLTQVFVCISPTLARPSVSAL